MTTKKQVKVVSISDERKCRRAYNIPPTDQLKEPELIEWLLKIATDSNGKYDCSWIGEELLRRFVTAGKRLLRQQKSYDELWNARSQDLARWEGELAEVRRIHQQKSDEAANFIAELEKSLGALRSENAVQREFIAELQQSMALRTDADDRAIQRWQEANPGNDHVWPDAARLTVWLMERLVELEAQASKGEDRVTVGER